MKTKVYFIRHAEPNYDNHDDISRELSPKGLQDSQQIVTILRDEQIDYFYSVLIRELLTQFYLWQPSIRKKYIILHISVNGK